MKKILENLKYIKFYDIISIFIFILLLIPSLFYKLYLLITRQQIWLITEDGHYARDNGYYFFKYMREKHKKFRTYYVIDKKSHDYAKVKPYGNIVQFRSIKHWIYYMTAKYNISSQKNGNPAQALFYILHVKLGLFNNRIFLQHGITINYGDWLTFNNTKFKIVTCGAAKEHDFFKNTLGYSEDNTLYTGFPRFDSLKDTSKTNQILIMPTWRNWLGRETNNFAKKESFKNTNYYKNWNGLINNPDFINFIEKNDIKVKFYPHVHMQKFLSEFTSKSKNIEIISTDVDIQTAMKESSIMITDFSSVAMDFAYMEKPIFYFQFDQKEYREKQLKPGYFDYEKDGFGPVVTNQKDLIAAVKNSFKKGNFSNPSKYQKREHEFYNTKDTNNSNRIYEALLAKETNEHPIISNIILPLFYFCYIFMFNIYGPIDSSFLVGGLLFLFFIINKPFRNHTIKLLRKQNIEKTILITGIILLWSIAAILINQSNDLSLLRNFCKVLITILIGFYLYSATDYYNQSSKIVNYILIAFLMQTIFQWICFASPNFSDAFNYFRSSDAIQVAKRYKGFRGIALTKTPYFVLSVSYALSFIIYATKYNTLFKNHTILKIIGFIVLVSGNIFAGRIGFIGLLFVPFLINWRNIKWRRPSKRAVAAIIAIVLAITGISAIVSNTPQGKRLSKYAFEITNNLLAGKGVSTGSTNKLFEMFDHSFAPKTLLIGDGRFEGDNDQYYMKTDVGYYRKIYFGGIVFLLLIIAWHFSLFRRKTKAAILITILLFIAELKGVSIGQNAIAYATIIMFILCSNNYYEKLHHTVKASVLLPTLNTNEQYLKKSITSILTQTHQNFEFIIVVDGGNDDKFITKNFKDDRIIIIKHDKPHGIAKSLNEAIKTSTGKYLIRMDADDISRNSRLEEQIIYMEEHPDITVAGTFVDKFGDSRVLACESFTKPNDIYAKSLFVAPIIHPSVIMRASTIKDNKEFNYNPTYERAEDYELWRRIMESGHKISTMKYFGLFYRVHANQISTAKREEQSKILTKIYNNSLQALHLPDSNEKYLFILSGRSKLDNKKDLKRFIKKVLLNNKKYKVYNQYSLRRTLLAAYNLTCLKNKTLVFPNIYFISFCTRKLFYKLLFIPAIKNKKRYN